jgi:hypothetical protein
MTDEPVKQIYKAKRDESGKENDVITHDNGDHIKNSKENEKRDRRTDDEYDPVFTAVAPVAQFNKNIIQQGTTSNQTKTIIT